ncbi:cytochrome oxidase assembly protein ShyY1 [Actinoalloteichus hoggarensis]|uniref:SURF1 family cytochrome oxidase biogenesis protein n=1 Tax=Actinoalloteichus hoggarensis TaxID=1470176 RepID=UPI0012FDEFA6|nr:SURF1 family cytochrome oxidase biogenesis protein [Actinoalloteichus hoggarensis]MBB5923327.1 cytochrome oxidase assembly protein ShyY1 [Actinoalloteichus hoggarensis]
MRYRFLLRPGWITMTVAVLVFAAISVFMLSPWQLGRHDDKLAQNEAIERSQGSDAVPLNSIVSPDAAPGDDAVWQQVSVEGRYLPDGETVARLRSVHGEPAYEVLTPFASSDGTTVLINRGFVRPDDEGRVPEFPAAPTEPTSLTARVRTDENDTRRRAAFEEDGRLQVYAINSETVAEAVDIPLRAGYLQLTADQPGGLGALPLPRLNSGLNLAYGLQWVAFGAMALGALVFFIWREAHPRPEQATAGAEETTAPAESRMSTRSALRAAASERPATTTRTTTETLADRYGGRR